MVAKDWYPNGGPAIDLGKMEMIQQSEYELTNADITLKGLSENSGYHVHLTPVEFHLEFPCEARFAFFFSLNLNILQKL